MDIKIQILLELEGKKRTALIHNLNYEFGEVDEISTLDLPFLCIPFLNGIVCYNLNLKEKACENLKDFKFLCEDKKIISKTIEKIVSSSLREDKIRLYNLKRDFVFHYIDWEDRDWILKLCEYFYVVCCERIKEIERVLEMEKGVCEKVKPVVTGLKYVMVPGDGAKKGHPPSISPSLSVHARNNLLKRRINPKYSLEEFGDVLVERLKKPEKINNSTITPTVKDLKTLREEDEDRDDRHVQKGNSKNVG